MVTLFTSLAVLAGIALVSFALGLFLIYVTERDLVGKPPLLRWWPAKLRLGYWVDWVVAKAREDT